MPTVYRWYHFPQMLFSSDFDLETHPEKFDAWIDSVKPQLREILFSGKVTDTSGKPPEPSTKALRIHASVDAGCDYVIATDEGKIRWNEILPDFRDRYVPVNYVEYTRLDSAGKHAYANSKGFELVEERLFARYDFNHYHIKVRDLPTKP